jgi:hypothetical protein
VLGPHEHDPNWEEEQNGAANNLRVFGGNPDPDAAHQHHHIVPGAIVDQPVNANMEIDSQVEDVDEDEDDPWLEWNPAIPTVPEQQQPPHHPAFPQHFIDLDLSNSSMRFLRATGPDISLDDALQGSVSDDNSSSSDATSIPDEN